MHQYRISPPAMRMYGVVHDTALQIHEEMISRVSGASCLFSTCMDSSAAKYFDEFAGLNNAGRLSRILKWRMFTRLLYLMTPFCCLHLEDIWHFF